ncbi:MAG: xrtH [Ignavibacteria bacterium]|nr:xrtH [Ignavibacteria bacterium]
MKIFEHIKFILIFGGLLAIYYVGFATKFLLFILEPYRLLTARIAGYYLNSFNSNIITKGDLIILDDFSIKVGYGCEGSEPIALLLSAVLAFPVKFKLKIPALLFGTLFIYCLNIVRIIVLFYLSKSDPAAADSYHNDILPLILTLFAILFFILWVRWALKKIKNQN